MEISGKNGIHLKLYFVSKNPGLVHLDKNNGFNNETSIHTFLCFARIIVLF